jgi:hypothetical protein
VIYLVLGVAAGLGIALGPLSFLQRPADAVSGALVAAARHLLDALTHALPAVAAHSVGVRSAALVLSLFAPGLVCFALVRAARAATHVRRIGAGAAVVAAIAGFALLPAGQAWLVCLVCVLVAALMATVGGLLLTVPLTALATSLGVSLVQQTLHRTAGNPSAQAAMQLAHLIGGDPTLWALVLSVAAMAPVLYAARSAVRI